MKICLVNVAANSDSAGEGTKYFDMLQKNFRKVLRPETNVVIKHPKRGLREDRPLDFRNGYFDLLNKREVIEVFIEAEEEGFDAAVVNCGGDTGVREARAVLRMPIIGPLESGLLHACQLGNRFGVIVSNMADGIAQTEQMVKQYGLQDRLLPNGVRYDIHPFDKNRLADSLKNPKLVADGVQQTSMELVRDGADVIVIRCCAIGPFCSAAGVSKITMDGREIPVIDSLTVAVKSAEMTVDLGRGLGIPATSKKIPTQEDMTAVRKMFGLSV